MKTKKCSARDVISYLPCDVKENILKRLILRDAVRTSILSREWRYKWATLPALVLLFSSQLKLSDNQDFNAVINQILMIHQGPVKEFEVRYMDLESSRYLPQWFDLLSKYHLQRLFLHWWLGPKGYGRLPSNFFSFSQLRYLYLSKCVLRPPSSFKGLSSLVSLEFENVKIKTHKLSSLISKSPFLERVVIRNLCDKFKTLRIWASKLKKFLFLGIASSIYFVNVPLLEEVHIVLSGRSDEVLPYKVKQDNFMKSLAQLSSITKLVLNGFLKVNSAVAIDGVWQNLTFDMNHLKILGLEISSFELAEVSCAICLIRSAPNLESLNFIISAHDQQISTTTQFLVRQHEHSISFNGLKKVSIWWLGCKEPDIELVQLIFSFSPALEKFIIPPSYEGSCLLDYLVSMPKASPKVEIVLDYMDTESKVFDFMSSV
ncbi:F-box/FBD/LRR-repeat protein At1g13570-like isoform X1 [Primulina huaijiensis]|uniref:F-box/FBD/LRR-repeat protein At1g13570-like isoform X1 n=1 Tax=Primulina huaijiensis TaxID=1492673 RepID=UPI003CC75BED